MAATFLERADDRLAVDAVTDANEALDRLDAGTVDCVVSDYDMPGRNGIEFLEAVRETDPTLPFILFTGKGSEAVASDAISAGVTDYLQKESGTDQYTVLANRITNAVKHDRSQRLVERSENRLREIIDSLPHLLFVVDEEGTYLLANEVLATFHDTTVAALEGSNVVDVLDRQPTGQFRADIEEVFETGEPKRVSAVEIADATGEAHVFEPRLLPYDLTDDDGRAVLGIAVDVTEREDRERELERTNTVLSTLVDTLPAGVLVEDEDRNVLKANDQLFDLFGMQGTPAEAVGEDCHRLAAAVSGLFDDPEAFVAGIDDAVTGGEDVRDEALALRDGRTFARNYRRIDLTDGDGHLWMYRDVSDRTRRERRLEALNETTRELMAADTAERIAEIGVEAANDVLDLGASSIHLHDDAASGLVPVAYTDALGDLVGDPPTFTGEGSIAWRSYDRGEAFAVGDVRDASDVYNPETPLRSELYLPLGDHGILLAGATRTGAFDQDDLVVGKILAGSLAAALEQVSRTQELRDRERELARRNEQLESFASILSHDLRNPLNVATGQLELAMEECNSDSLPPIERSLDRMATLIDDLLTLAREGASVGEMEPVDLGSLTRTCWGTVETGDANLTVETERTVVADRSRLRQLVENLVRNAVEHSSTGNRTPSDDAVEHSSTGNRTPSDDAVEHSSTGNRTPSDDAVEHSSTGNQSDVTVTVGGLADGFFVADDGPGIPADEREVVFDAGYSTGLDGTGLGLQIVERVADAHGWDVSVADSADGGTRIEITGVEFEAGASLH
ncbi:hypothetical protein JCM17092_22860 [Haloplanus litoreus]